MSKKQPDIPVEQTAEEAEIVTAMPEQEIPADNALQKELEALKTQLAERNDQLLRTAAEFDNYKKRTLREKDAAAAFLRASTIKALLPCYDGLDRALKADSSSPDYAKGLELSLRQLMEGFCKLGLQEICPVGEPFDPEFHEAVLHVEDESAGESVVLEVLQKGYKMGDTVLRPAMVKVAN